MYICIHIYIHIYILFFSRDRMSCLCCSSEGRSAKPFFRARGTAPLFPFEGLYIYWHKLYSEQIFITSSFALHQILAQARDITCGDGISFCNVFFWCLCCSSEGKLSEALFQVSVSQHRCSLLKRYTYIYMGTS